MCAAIGAPRPNITVTTTAPGDYNITMATTDFNISQPAVLPASSASLTIESLSFADHNGSYVCTASSIDPQTGVETTVSTAVDIIVLGKLSTTFVRCLTHNVNE